MATQRQGESFEAFAERQIREAQDEGSFHALPGTGQPLAGIDKPYDPLWWVKQKLARERLEALPPALAIRREAEAEVALILALRSEREVRARLEALNAKIRRVNSTVVEGPPTTLAPLDVEAMVERWRTTRGTAS